MTARLRNRFARRAALPAAIAAAVALAAFRTFGFHQTAAIDVTTAAVTTGPVVRRIVATGTLQPVTTVEVGAQVSGTIQALGADYNSIVHAGQIVARLDPSVFDAALRGAEASLQQAEAALATAEADKNGYEAAVEDARMKLARAEQLGLRQLIAQADLDAAHIAMHEAAANLGSATSQVVAAAAAVDQARAAVAQAKVNLDHTVITSPIDGIVTARNVDVGQTIAASVQAPVLFDIAADLRRMQLQLEIDEGDIAGVQAGESVSFDVESYPNQTFRGIVSSIRLQPVVDQTTPTAAATTAAPSATPPPTSAAAASTATASLAGTVVSYATIVDVDNPDERLRPGMTATALLTGARRENAVRVPSAAMSFRPPQDVLTALGEPAAVPAPPDRGADSGVRRLWRYDGGQFTPIDVRVGLAGGEFTEIVAGAEPGDLVVTNATTARAR